MKVHGHGGDARDVVEVEFSPLQEVLLLKVGEEETTKTVVNVETDALGLAEL